MNAGAKRLNEMNRLGDMGHFPAVVNAGATVNVLATVTVTWFVRPRFAEGWAPVAWIALVLAVNLLPVLLLRLGISAETTYPTLAEMDFVRDQHKFSDWVYVRRARIWRSGCWAAGRSSAWRTRLRRWPGCWWWRLWRRFCPCSCGLCGVRARSFS